MEEPPSATCNSLLTRQAVGEMHEHNGEAGNPPALLPKCPFREMEESRMKKITVRKAGTVRLTSVAHALYTSCVAQA